MAIILLTGTCYLRAPSNQLSYMLLFLVTTCIVVTVQSSIELILTKENKLLSNHIAKLFDHQYIWKKSINVFKF